MFGNYMPPNYMQVDALQQQLNKYQQIQQPPQQIQQPQQPTSNINWIFVTNEQQAKEYSVVPNNTMWFMNSENSEIYAKACDQMGMTTFKAFSIIEKQVKQTNNENANDYVPRSEFEELKSEIEMYKQLFTKTDNETKKGGTK